MANDVLDAEKPPLENKAQLIDELAAGCKPPEEWRIGSEQERFLFHKDTLAPVAYEGGTGFFGIEDVLLNFVKDFGAEPILEDGNIIGARRGETTISLEPGGQFELSGAPLSTLHDTWRELEDHYSRMCSVLRGIGIGMFGVGFHPFAARSDMHWMPKGRYRIMRDHMAKRGQLGLDMMLRTCTIQVNLDFSSESDMIRKMRVSMALQPVVTAIFANSPFVEGKLSGWLSYRSHIWEDTDAERCGLLSFVFDADFGFERWVDYLLDVPMYFVKRDGRYVDTAGRSFRDFMRGELPELPGVVANMDDWQDHITVAFPEVRLRRYIEMRGADSGSIFRQVALSALWVGLLYDEQAMAEMEALIADWTAEERMAMRSAAAISALAAPFRDGTIGDLARRVVAAGRAGLVRRARLDHARRDETRYLDGITEIIRTGKTIADQWVQQYQNRWDGHAEKMFHTSSM